jgi:alanine racemase
VALRALARVNLAAIQRNAARLRARLADRTELCAVVKAQASGHGAVPTARAALAGGATRLAVATALEAAELRDAGLTAPILIMGAISAEELPIALAAGAELVGWSERFVDDVARAAGSSSRPVAVHVKLDTGMGRLGTRDLAAAVGLAERLASSAAPGLSLAGAMTHFATADCDPAFLAVQLQAFAPFVQRLRDGERGHRVVVHAANSAATVNEPASHFDMVRCGIALYGCDPMNQDPDDPGLEPAMQLSSYVAAVKRAMAGESCGYGRQFIAQRDTWIATLPIGYADGIRRGLSNNCDVLIDGRRYPLVGTVSMDNITVDVGPATGAAPVEVEQEAIIIGRSGNERQTVEDLANRLDTVNHEVLCGISGRVPRQYHRDGEPSHVTCAWPPGSR